MNIMNSNFMGFATARDEVTDPERGEEERESPDDDKDYICENQYASSQHEQPSVFSTLTELLFNPFLDGYCKTPFCSDSDYMPPSCPAGTFYSTHEEDGDHTRTIPQTPQRTGSASAEDEYGDICRSGSGASSAANSQQRRRRRPLALAVGYGDDLKDQEGRRVVITPRASRSYRASSCTCGSRVPKAQASHSPRDQETSPHQSKVVMCKYCTTIRMREEGLLPCQSGSDNNIAPNSTSSYGRS